MSEHRGRTRAAAGGRGALSVGEARARALQRALCAGGGGGAGGEEGEAMSAVLTRGR